MAILRHCLFFCFLLSVSLIPLVFSPFGIDLTSWPLNYKLQQVFMSPFYDVKESNEVLAIIVTDDTVDAMDGQSWPIDYERHGDILAAIMQFEPCAIVIDINFTQHRQQDDTLTEMIALVNEARQDFPLQNSAGQQHPCLSTGEDAKEIPLIAAAGGQETLTRRERVPRYNDALLGAVMVPAVSAWPPSDVNYPLFVNRHATEPGPPQMTLAMRAFYETKLRRLAAGGKAQAVLAPFQEDIFLQWGYDTPVYPEDVAFAFEGRGCRKNLGWCENLQEILANPGKWLKGFTKEPVPAQPCPPILQMDARNLLPQYWPGNDFLKAMIRGKVIVYGANIASYPDLYESPVHGALPALFYHAVALDNLLAERDDYLKYRDRDDLPLFGGTSARAIDFGIVVIFCALLYRTVCRRRASDTAISNELGNTRITQNPRRYPIWESRETLAHNITANRQLSYYIDLFDWFPVFITALTVILPFVSSNALPFHFVATAVSSFFAILLMRPPAFDSVLRVVNGIGILLIWLGQTISRRQ